MVWNAANVVTLVRFLLVPLVVVALLLGEDQVGWRWAAAAVFAFAAATDKVDGWLARRSGQVTDWGKLVDPIADKALVGAALVMLSVLGTCRGG